MQPIVSILTPFKNTELFLGDCIISILKQTYSHWELLIVDDFSTDGSYKIVEEFAKKDARIQLLKNKKPGIIHALRLALSKSKGNFITRMDSDDIMFPNKLESMVSQLCTYGSQHIALGLVNYFSETGIKEGYKNYEVWLNKLTKKGTNYSEIYKECVIPSPCWMIHKEDLIACDAFNPDRYPEDYDLAFRFYKYNIKCIPSNVILHKWRDYSSRASRTDKNYAENHFLSLKLKYFIELDYNKNKTLVVWGAGNKGKITAKILINNNISFEWICDNPNKIGRDIYGKKLLAFEALSCIKNPQSIITVANKQAQKEIKSYLKQLNMQALLDYVFFC
ncbi:glycosyl transferase family 2 [Pseudalgibacter alginicilyticus]|uniref:Glycosyl transferase family 2 n=1 Tax=Pseudalgibacter alginicilyticus TaxID=1736674 RepID=A0A0P0CUL5_9FLAO|nr:glycosyltransferase family 2 protein [Pseudalgibacter alginicilyticus]ALJ06637.1 glycosyl transferase family 2 [Pseudalgibacter alginicilyticus]